MRLTGTLDIDGSNLKLDQGGNATTIQSNSPSSSIAITLPDTACTLTGLNKAQTWTSAQTFNQNTLLINDDDASHTLDLLWNEAETVGNRTLNFKVNAGDRTVDLSANLTLATALTVNTGALIASPHASGNTLSFANTGTSQVAGNSNADDILTRTATQTGLTNKTFTELKVTGGATADIDTASATTLKIGNTNATAVTIGPTTTFTNDIVVTGDLTVNGTTTTVNTATVDIEDPNLTLNNGQAQAQADTIAGLTIEMSDATDAQLIYDTSSTSNWKIGLTGALVDVGDISSAQTLTNKSIDSDNNTITNITDADIKAAADITRTKMAPGTASYVLINDGSGEFSEEAQLTIGRGGTGQATAVAGFDALSPTTTKGDSIFHDGSNNVRVAIGADGQSIIADSTQTAGVKWASPVVNNPMTDTGDIIYSSDVSGTPTRLAIGTENQVLRVSASGILEYVDAIQIGSIPLGAIIPIASNLTGAYDVPDGVAAGSMDANGWQYCDGSAIDAAATMSGTIYNLTDDRFLRGDTSAGSTGGQATNTPTGTLTTTTVSWSSSTVNTSFTQPKACIHIPSDGKIRYASTTSHSNYTGNIYASTSVGRNTGGGTSWDEGAACIGGAASFNKNAMNSSQTAHGHTFNGSSMSIEPKYLNVQYIMKVK